MTRELRNTTIIRQGGTLTGHRCFQVTQAGSIDLQPQSILEVDIGGTTQCSRYDAVQNAPTGISGSICLDVIRSGGFSPGASALFTIFEVRGVAPNTGIFLQDCDLAQPVMEGQLGIEDSLQMGPLHCRRRTSHVTSHVTRHRDGYEREPGCGPASICSASGRCKSSRRMSCTAWP